MVEPSSNMRRPLLANAGSGGEDAKTSRSECHLQDKCFLTEGEASSREEYSAVQRKLIVACILCFIFMIIEIVGGWIAKSIAIMSDAAHMLSDVSAFLVSIFAAWAATQRGTALYSFGYHRAEILGALVSVLIIWLVTGALVFEAVQRTIEPVRVDGKLMFIISVAGIVFNIFVALALGVHGGHGHSHSHGDHDHGHGHGHSHDDHEHDHDDDSHSHDSHDHEDEEHGAGPSSSGAAADGPRAVLSQTGPRDIEVRVELPAGGGGAAAGAGGNGGNGSGGAAGKKKAGGKKKAKHADNINLRGAVLHVIGDLVQSVGVAIAGALIWAHQDDPRWYIADPICTFIFSVLVLWTTKSILGDILAVLMERAPHTVNPTQVAEMMAKVAGIVDVHDLHVWNISSNVPVLTAHVHIGDGADPNAVLAALEEYVRTIGVKHSTIQICNPTGENGSNGGGNGGGSGHHGHSH